MRLVTLFLIAAFAASTVGAASYQKTDGTIVDPIMNRSPRTWTPSYPFDPHPGEPHSYSGANLEPEVDLHGPPYWSGANLSYADLSGANLYGADLAHSNLTTADLTNANLTGVYLYKADLRWADLRGADLSNAIGTSAGPTSFSGHADLERANLSGAVLPMGLAGSNWSDAFYYTDNEPVWYPGFYYTYRQEAVWHPGMDQAWRDSEGILAIDPTSGDINSDGVFDAADYTVWRDNLPRGRQGEPNLYYITYEHYNLYGKRTVWMTFSYWIDYRTWKDHFGQSTVPEPPPCCWPSWPW